MTLPFHMTVFRYINQSKGHIWRLQLPVLSSADNRVLRNVVYPELLNSFFILRLTSKHTNKQINE